MFGGDGNDILLAGLLTGGNVTKANLPNLPREIHFKNESTKRETFGSYGDMDIDGGAGNDFIIGSVGSDDIFGGAGDDVIYGSQPFRGTMPVSNTDRGNDEIDGGKGDDLIFGVSIAD